MSRVHARLQQWWYSKELSPGVLLIPLGWLYALVMRVRGWLYALRILPADRVAVPVIVVGNIAVGGTGKTPLVIALAGYLAQQGWRPGIICRGYGGKAHSWPQQVRADSDPASVGDEAVLLARRTGCPVAAAGSRRVAAARGLIENDGCNIIISDDGLQHLALLRDIEIALIDGERRHGNGRCLPAGPLREPTSRLASVDLIVTNAASSTQVHRGELPMSLAPGPAVNVRDPSRRAPLHEFNAQPVHAVAGIGNPGRFFSMLERAGVQAVGHAFADHHAFARQDLAFGDELVVLMTEKDAVKCSTFAADSHWYVPVTAQLPDAFFVRLGQRLPDVPAERARQQSTRVDENDAEQSPNTRSAAGYAAHAHGEPQGTTVADEASRAS
ncbi:MAG: tetraacyldisaccharide 4'-kinase [Gammaproteobacteria bacterium]